MKDNEEHVPHSTKAVREGHHPQGEVAHQDDECCHVAGAVGSEPRLAGSASELWSLLWPSIISLALLLTALVLDYAVVQTWFSGSIRLGWYLLCYAIVGGPVLWDAWKSIRRGDIFSEFFLMGIATLGAFYIGEYPEGVAVMLFYAVGEVFQHMAVRRAKRNIEALLDQRPEVVTVFREGQWQQISTADAGIGDIIQLKPGEKITHDGLLRSATAYFDTSALTGESKPSNKRQGERVLAGMITLQQVAEVEITTAFGESKLSRIIALVGAASLQKAPTELFIRKFAKIYTPIVVFLALAIVLVPIGIVEDYVFDAWLYRALIFLVISCPCALVISIPLGYFGGIGAASRHGILVKGSTFLDSMAAVEEVVMDKTGTLTEGVFAVQEVVLVGDTNREELLRYVNAVEGSSSHPIATAIGRYVGAVDSSVVIDEQQEHGGMGIEASIEGKKLFVGNAKLLLRAGIEFPASLQDQAFTTLGIAYGGVYRGYITIADQLKEDASAAVQALQEQSVRVTMLSGDKDAVVQAVAQKLGIAEAYGDLLPEEKVAHVEALLRRGRKVAFVGDGVNDAPVIAISHVGVAMGGLGSDATIETADIVIQDDRPTKIATAIAIGKKTKHIVWQNISLAFAVKAVVLLLGAGGIATMWEAVFADVGVSLLAILNAIRIQRMKF